MIDMYNAILLTGQVANNHSPPYHFQAEEQSTVKSHLIPLSLESEVCTLRGGGVWGGWVGGVRWDGGFYIPGT